MNQTKVMGINLPITVLGVDMAKIILTDVDETVLRFADIFQDWVAANRGIVFPDRLRDNYRPGISALAEDFIRTSNMAGSLPPEEDAIEVIPHLYADGWQFVAITACPSDMEMQIARRKNLEDVFGFKWSGVHCVGLDGNKEEILRTYPKAIWVEDNHKHAKTGSIVGHNSFILDRPYNKGDDTGITRVDSWHDIFTIINEG